MPDTAATNRRSAHVLPVCLAAQILGILLSRAADSPLPGWIALPFALTACLCLRKPLRLAGFALIACAVGMITGWYAYHPDIPAEGEYVICGTVCDELAFGDRGQVKTRLCRVTLDGAPAPGDAYWSFYPDELPADLAPGCAITFSGRAYQPSSAANPSGFDFRGYLLGQGITYAVYGDGDLAISSEVNSLRGIVAALRHRLVNALAAVMGEDAGGYAAAMLLGAKQRIPSDDREAFSRVGAAHVLVVSGFHVGVLAALLERLLRKRSLACRTAASGAVITAYALLVGAHAPVVRALLLYVLSQAGKILRRPRPLLWSLCGCASLVLLLNPAQLTSASFQLTYAAVLGMAVIAPWIKSRTLGYSLGAQAGVLLPVLYCFHELPILGLAVNLVLLPAASALISLYWLTLAVLPLPWIPAVIGKIAAIATQAMTAVIGWLNALPVASLWTCQANGLTLLAWVVFLAALSPLIRLTVRRRSIIACAAGLVMLLSVMPAPHTTTEYIQLSAGSADAAVLWDEEHVAVIDTGEDGRALSDFLHQRRLSVDALILTHLHMDHAGGVQSLLDSHIPITTLYLPWGTELTDAPPEALALLDALAARGTAIRSLSRGDEITLPSGRLTVLWPEADRVRTGADANAASLVLRAEIEGVTLLLAGDLSGAYARYAATPADVLKAAHHGASGDSPEAFLRAVIPQAVLVSSGRTNDLAALRARADAPVYDTHTRGAITLHLREGTYSVETVK